MKAEVLIYAYLAVCVAMIGFNIVCIFSFRIKDKRLEHYSSRFMKIVRKTIENQKVTDSHCRFLSKKLKKINHLMAFDKTLEDLFAQDPEQAKDYIRQLSSVFTYLTLEYRKKSEIQAAYFPYIIKNISTIQKPS